MGQPSLKPKHRYTAHTCNCSTTWLWSPAETWTW